MSSHYSNRVRVRVLGNLSPVEGPWPLVGRQAELERATALCRGGGVLIAGPPGVGKSRLAAEVVRAVDRTRTVQVRATRVSSRMPLGAFAQVLAASGAFPEDAARLGDAANQLLDGLVDGERALVWVDDVHCLDDTSATLLLHLALSGRVDLVLTLRTGETTPEPVTALWRDELVVRLDLAPLERPSMGELLGTVLPGGIDGLAASTLIDATAGNLLHLRELVSGLRSSGTLERSRGHWVLTGPVTAPPRLVELIEQRLGALSAPARTLLDAVALGEPLGVYPVEAQEAWPLVEELLDAGLVELVRDGRRRQLVAVHPLHLEVARSTMSEPLTRQLLDSLADALDLVGCRRRDDARRLATWRLDAERPADPHVLVDAAREALWGSDRAMCERFARAALEHDDLEDTERLAAAHLLGTALDDLGRFEEAEALMAEHEPGAGSGAERTLLALERSANLFRGLGRQEAALQVLSDAEAVVEDPLLLDELSAQRASFAVLGGDVATTLELTEPLLDRSDDRAFCEGALQAAVAHTLAGRTVVAMEIATKAFETRIALGDQVQLADPGIHLVALAMAQLDAGLLAQGAATADAAYAGAVRVRDRHGQAWLAVMLSRSHLLAGRLDQALRLSREAAVVFGELCHPGTRWGFGGIALAAGQMGDAAVATAALEDLDADPPTPIVLMDAEVDRGRSWSLVAEGRESAARELLWTAADRARGAGQYGLEAGVLHDLARLGDAAAVAGRIGELGGCVDGVLMSARADHVAGLAAGDGDLLDRAATTFAEMGAQLFAAEAAGAAAECHRRAGETRRAAASEQRARRAAELCPGAATPALQVLTAVAPLTRREREVAGLAAQGRTNREIADGLVVSVRTVENHLQRVYAKLGVGSREELRAALEPLTP